MTHSLIYTARSRQRVNQGKCKYYIGLYQNRNIQIMIVYPLIEINLKIKNYPLSNSYLEIVPC